MMASSVVEAALSPLLIGLPARIEANSSIVLGLVHVVLRDVGPPDDLAILTRDRGPGYSAAQDVADPFAPKT